MIATSVALLAGASSAQAAGCPATLATPIFAGLGDLAWYSLAPGGNFESGTTGWTLTGSSVVSGNDSVALGLKGTKSLAVSSTGKAVSAPFCVGIEHPSFRFAARKTSGTWATMLVKVRWWLPGGAVNETTLGALNGGDYPAWKATPSIMLATALPLTAVGQSVTAQIVFDPEDSGGAWQVDDLYIDPYRRS